MNKKYFVLGNLGNYVVETGGPGTTLNLALWVKKKEGMKENGKWSLEIGITGTSLLRKKWRLSVQVAELRFETQGGLVRCVVL